MEQRQAPEPIADTTRADAGGRTTGAVASAPGTLGPSTTPDALRTPPNVMPVTGKPLPEPDQPSAPPEAVAVPKLPATPPPSTPGTSQVIGIRGPGAEPPPAPPRPVPPPPAVNVPAPPIAAAPPPAAVAPVPDAAPPVAPPPPPAMAAVPPATVSPPPPPTTYGAPSVTLLALEVEFPSSSNEITPAQRRGLEDAVRLHRQGGGRMKVVGLTPRPARDDRAGRAEAMLAGFGAALERANAVARELVRLGVRESAIDVATAPPGGGREGRRVEVYVEY
ncbi:MAG: hypothetical protein AB7O45_03360 [Alphaproteobacteria bacterium]